MTIQPTTRLHNGRVLLLHGKAEDRLKQIKDNYVDLTVTSPPYDDLRTYNGFSFDFETIAKELFRVTKVGGIVVWVVADQTKNFCESVTSFKQAIYFVETYGFNLLDTMIYDKSSYPPTYPNMRRYVPIFEYMFVFTKNKPKVFNPIKDKPNKHAGAIATSTQRQRNGVTRDAGTTMIQTFAMRTNVWQYNNNRASAISDKIPNNHAAIFPEQLANDHIVSWSNENDIVLDPFMGSGTTGKMAILNNRRFIGIELSDEYITDIALPRCQQAIESLTNTL